MCIGKIVFAWCYNIKNAGNQRGINLVVNHFRMLSRDHPVTDEGSTNTGLSQVIGGDQLDTCMAMGGWIPAASKNAMERLYRLLPEDKRMNGVSAKASMVTAGHSGS